MTRSTQRVFSGERPYPVLSIVFYALGIIAAGIISVEAVKNGHTQNFTHSEEMLIMLVTTVPFFTLMAAGIDEFVILTWGDVADE